MGKRITALTIALFLLLGATAPAARAENTELTTVDEVMELLQQGRKNKEASITFYCTQELFDLLYADNGAEMDRLGIRTGTDWHRVRFYTDRKIFLDSTTYNDNPWAEVNSVQQARQMILRILKSEPTAFALLCPLEVVEELSSGRLRNYLGQGGVQSLQPEYLKSGIVKVKELSYFTAPWAAVSNAAEFNKAIEGFAADSKDDFYLVYDWDYFDQLQNEKGAMAALHAGSMLDKYGYSGSNAILHYYSVRYTDQPTVLCYDKDDVVQAIARMGSLGVTAFRLYLVDPDLRSELMEGKHEALHALEAQAGMSSASTAYSSTTIYYEDAKITSDIHAVATLEEAIALTEEKAAAGETEITLFCEAEVYDYLIGKLGGIVILANGMDPIYDLAAHAGIFDYSLGTSRATGAITIQVKAYYPGTDILRAVNNGTESSLPRRLRQALDIARELAEDCQADSPLETARNIHDRLCELVVYTDDESTDEDDTAIGALCNGEANCDGYADAFLLVGTLAGLNVRYQHGDSYGSFGVSFPDAVTHMWNLLEIDGSWRMVDVTWDDEEESGPMYTWFNLGQDRSVPSHIWNEDMSKALLAKTDLSVRPENEFSVTDADSAAEAAEKVNASGAGTYTFLFDDEDYTDYNAVLKSLQGSLCYSWNSKMRLLLLEKS